MNRSEFMAYCLTKPGAWLDEPWPGDQVVKVADKIFAFLGAADSTIPAVTIKCGRNSDEARELRDQYPDAVSSSRYIGHRGWNSVRLDGTVPADELEELVDASYETIVSGLPKSRRP
jgi:predicted DNA-binding protein (MmcQ/YjbR family)